MVKYRVPHTSWVFFIDFKDTAGLVSRKRVHQFLGTPLQHERPIAQVDEVIMGHILTAGQGQNTARQAALKAGIPVEVPAMAINKLCGSGLKATHLAAQAILCGDADIVVAGGQESMTRAAHVMLGGREGVKMGEIKLYDTMLQDGLHDAFQGYHMGITAENIAEKYGLSREE